MKRLINILMIVTLISTAQASDSNEEPRQQPKSLIYWAASKVTDCLANLLKDDEPIYGVHTGKYWCTCYNCFHNGDDPEEGLSEDQVAGILAPIAAVFTCGNRTSKKTLED